MLLSHLSGAVACVTLLGCSSLDGYTTGPGESYCGTVTAGSNFLAGLPSGMTMRLTLDATELDGEASPGAVWATPDTAGPSPDARLFDGAPLRRIPALENDPLSTPDLGGGRDHTRLFALTPAPVGEDPFLAAISLRSDNGVEARLVRPGTASPHAGQQPVFSLFVLYKQAGTCTF